MLQRDYLLRNIEEMSKVLAIALGFVKKEEFFPALDKLEGILNNYFPFTSEELLKWSPEELCRQVTEVQPLPPESIRTLAEWLETAAEAREGLKSGPKAVWHLQQALALHALLDGLQPEVFSFDRIQRKMEMENRLERLKRNAHPAQTSPDSGEQTEHKTP